MKVEVELDPNCTEIIVKIHTKEMNNETLELMKNLEAKESSKIIAYFKEKAYILELKDIETIYSNQGKVYVRENNNEYVSKNKLYELEESIKESSFIRISNSEIINFNRVENLDLSISGTIKIKFKSGYITYASRRNIKKIKEYLKI